MRQTKMSATTWIVILLVLAILASIAYNFRNQFHIEVADPLVVGTLQENTPILSHSHQAAPAATTTTNGNKAMTSKDQRAFVIGKHRDRGYLVLYAFKNRKGGKHGQIPGGRVDEGEMREIAAVRELREETGIAVSYKRLKPLMHVGEKHFFLLELTDEDSVERGTQVSSLGDGDDEGFCINLSSEHVDFKFIPDALQAAQEIRKHSGGTCAYVLEQLVHGGALL